LQPGGVYLCEDLVFVANKFPGYLYGWSRHLNAYAYQPGGFVVDTSPLQRAIHSVHLYPYVAVIEKAAVALDHFEMPMHGTEWLPQGPYA
jgi:hypothetical protein